jgi:hypothetical protein
VVGEGQGTSRSLHRYVLNPLPFTLHPDVHPPASSRLHMCAPPGQRLNGLSTKMYFSLDKTSQCTRSLGAAPSSLSPEKQASRNSLYWMWMCPSILVQCFSKV